MNRKDFVQQLGLYSVGSFLPSAILRLTKKNNPTILLISGWQDVNIGDIAHTPGLLHILQTFLPKATILLWKRSRGEMVQQLLRQHFPVVKILYGSVNNEYDVDAAEVQEAFQKADLMIHGSGPMLVGADNLASWLKHTQKPFGVFGTTLENPNAHQQGILQKAAFIYTRETKSIEHLRKAGITGEHIQFAPDATFFLAMRNDNKADEFLKQHDLQDKKFICAVPRLRYTPYHQINPNNNGWSAEKIKSVETTNEKYKEIDHAKMRAALIAWVRETKNKVLICPEMTYQVDIMDELLIEPLPEDVKPYIVKRGYWLPDEAASVYAKAYAVLSFECHSPIIAAANGTPFFYLRQPEDTIKGQMYYDLGFDDWIFEIEQTDDATIVNRLKMVQQDYKKAKSYLKSGMSKVEDHYKKRTAAVQQLLKNTN